MRAARSVEVQRLTENANGTVAVKADSELICGLGSIHN